MLFIKILVTFKFEIVDFFAKMMAVAPSVLTELLLNVSYERIDESMDFKNSISALKAKKNMKGNL